MALGVRFFVFASLRRGSDLTCGHICFLTACKLFSAEALPSASKQALQSFCFRRIHIP
nr:MAG TPA: hypothetical protein [Caudoviricetes sp.]